MPLFIIYDLGNLVDSMFWFTDDLMNTCLSDDMWQSCEKAMKKLWMNGQRIPKNVGVSDKRVMKE